MSITEHDDLNALTPEQQRWLVAQKMSDWPRTYTLTCRYCGRSFSTRQYPDEIEEYRRFATCEWCY